MKILTLFISSFGVLFTSYITINMLTRASSLDEWLYFSIAFILLLICVTGVLLNFDSIKTYRNRVRFM